MMCPHCGEPLSTLDVQFDASTGIVESGGRKVTLGPIQLHILECLIDAYPRGVNAGELANEVYSDRPDDRDGDPINAVRASVLVIRKKMVDAGFPWEISRYSIGNDRGSAYVLFPAESVVFAKTA